MFETKWDILNDIQSNQLTDDDIIRNILINKGMTEEDEIKEFLSDKPKKTYEPLLFKDMPEAIELIVKHIKEKKSIWIYGDYDVDGITSISLLMDFLSNFTDNLNYYIPLRHEEGYGVNADAIRDIKNKGGQLIITVDCGSTSATEISLAKELGMEIIVTDHHNMGDEKPECLIINPKQEDCEYPFKLLCGCGIAFKLAQGIRKELNAPKSYLTRILDLVALGTVADVVSLQDENRTLLKYGLKQIHKGTRPGLKNLIEEIQINLEDVSAGDIGYRIAPHFNASGRIDDARDSVELLLLKDEIKIKKQVKYLIECNEKRRELQKYCEEKCKDIVEQKYKDDLFLVVNSRDGHEGVVGIVAGRIRDTYYKPTLIISEAKEKGMLKGSGRSIDDIDIYKELKKHEHLFTKFGGHKNACGFSLKEENLEELRKKLNEEASHMEEDVFVQKIKIDCELTPDLITLSLIEKLRCIEPYGMGNSKPKFLIRNFNITNPLERRIVGNFKNHIRLEGQFNFKGKVANLNMIGFNLADKYLKELNGQNTIEVVGFPEINEFRGQRSPQFKIQDIKNL